MRSHTHSLAFIMDEYWRLSFLILKCLLLLITLPVVHSLEFFTKYASRFQMLVETWEPVTPEVLSLEESDRSDTRTV